MARGALAVALVVAALAAPVGVDTTPAPPTALHAAAIPSGRPDRCAPTARAPTRAADRVDHAVAERLRLAALHTLATGRGQRIAVIDTGVAPHPRLAGRLVGLGDYLAGGDGLDDCDGHGTAVAGLIAAAPDPGDDLVGVAPDAQILALRQFSPSITGDADHPSGDLPTLAAALRKAIRAGATVINISGAVCVPAATAAVVGAPVRAALDAAVAADVVVVAAAGNVDGGGCGAVDGSGDQVAPDRVSLPGWFGDDLLAVGAVDGDDRPAAFTVPGPWVDVAAPGTDLRSLAVGGGTGAPLDGTSFAAPYVAGLAALIRERDPRLTAHQVAERITATARRPAAGRDDAIGFGVVDPVAALTAEPAVLRPVPAAAAGRGTAARVVTQTHRARTVPAWPVVALAGLLAVAGAALAAPRRAGR